MNLLSTIREVFGHPTPKGPEPTGTIDLRDEINPDRPLPTGTAMDESTVAVGPRAALAELRDSGRLVVTERDEQIIGQLTAGSDWADELDRIDLDS